MGNGTKRDKNKKRHHAYPTMMGHHTFNASPTIHGDDSRVTFSSTSKRRKHRSNKQHGRQTRACFAQTGQDDDRTPQPRTVLTSRSGQRAAVSSLASAFFTPARALPSRFPSTLLLASAVRVHHDFSSASKTTFSSFQGLARAHTTGAKRENRKGRALAFFYRADNMTISFAAKSPYSKYEVSFIRCLDYSSGV